MASFEVTPVGTGNIADGFKVAVTYAGDAAKARPAVVLKLSKDDPAVKLTNLYNCTRTNSAPPAAPTLTRRRDPSQPRC